MVNKVNLELLLIVKWNIQIKKINMNDKYEHLVLVHNSIVSSDCSESLDKIDWFSMFCSEFWLF